MAEKQRKKDRRFEYSDDVTHIGLKELVEIRQAEMESFMLPNQQTTVTNGDRTKKVVVKSRELNIKNKEFKRKRRTV